MKKFFVLTSAILTLGALSLTPATALADSTAVGNLTLQTPWARASTGGTRPAAAYLTIANAGAADQLTKANSPVAGRVEIHQITKDGDRMRMSEVPAIKVPKHGSVTLKPGGYHIMMMNLKQPLKPGETFPLTLTFANAGEVTVTAQVEKPDATRASSGHGAGHGHGHGKPLMIDAGPTAPSIDADITKDAVGGWNLHVKVTNFRFAPENASGKHIAGEGHAHIYVDGKKIARLYGPWFHIGSLPKDGARIRVTLNANDHRDIMVGGKPAEITLEVGKPAMNGHGHSHGSGGHSHK